MLELKQITNILIDLVFSENYDIETKEYLKLTLKDWLELEKEIKDLMDPTFNSRNVIKLRISNLQRGLMANFDNLATFYKEYKEVS